MHACIPSVPYRASLSLTLLIKEDDEGMAVASTSASPLKQLARPEKLTSKFRTEFTRLFDPATATPSVRWYRELFCLSVEPEVVARAVSDAETADLLGPLQPKVSRLFTCAVDELKRGVDPVRQQNAVEVRGLLRPIRSESTL